MNSTQDIIEWKNDYSLKVEDFQSKNHNFDYDAVSVLRLSYNFKTDHDDKQFWFTHIDCVAIFLKKQSWFRARFKKKIK